MEDLVGRRFGKLVVVRFSHTGKNGNVWCCKCDCGFPVETQCRESWLIKGKTTSCGCEKRNIDLLNNIYNNLKVVEKLGKIHKGRDIYWRCKCLKCGNENIVANTYQIKTNVKKCDCQQIYNHHKDVNSRLYKTLYDMRDRCYNPNHNEYKNYGARGIKICDEWMGKYGFENFYNWSIANGYKPDKLENGKRALSIDRINVDGNYEPSNCRWATNEIQGYNKRNTIYIEYNNKKYNLLELSKLINRTPDFIYRHYRKGRTIEEIKTMEEKKRKKS